MASLVGLFGMLLLTFMQDRALSIVGITSLGPRLPRRRGPYIGWRALTFVPAIVSTVGFRGVPRHAGRHDADEDHAS